MPQLPKWSMLLEKHSGSLRVLAVFQDLHLCLKSHPLTPVISFQKRHHGGVAVSHCVSIYANISKKLKNARLLIM